MHSLGNYANDDDYEEAPPNKKLESDDSSDSDSDFKTEKRMLLNTLRLNSKQSEYSGVKNLNEHKKYGSDDHESRGKKERPKYRSKYKNDRDKYIDKKDRYKEDRDKYKEGRYKYRDDRDKYRDDRDKSRREEREKRKGDRHRYKDDREKCRDQRKAHHEGQKSRSEHRSTRSSSCERNVKTGAYSKRYDQAASKAAQLKLGIEKKAPELKSQADRFFMPGITGMFTEQIRKRKMLWQKKQPENEVKSVINTPAAVSTSSGGKVWETTFAEDTDGKVANKFKRLMGIKGNVDDAAEQPTDTLKKQEEMFSSMEQQYEVARTTTHAMRGVGFGFGSFLR